MLNFLKGGMNMQVVKVKLEKNKERPTIKSQAFFEKK